jgi:hypothetical protein
MSSSDSGAVPATTLLIGSAAVAVLIAAGYMAMSGKKEAPPVSAEVKSNAAPSASAAKKDVLPPNPYSLTARFRDARARAELWNAKATLTRITAISVDGALTDELSFEFGAPVGRLLGPVEKSTRVFLYQGDDAKEAPGKGSAASFALPEPNCPLESAILTLRSTPGGLGGRFGILYDFSQKHRRAVWSFTRAEGDPISVDGDSCVLLVR